MSINVEYINPFLMAATNIIKDIINSIIPINMYLLYFFIITVLNEPNPDDIRSYAKAS